MQRSGDKVENDTVKSGRIGVFGGGTQKVLVGMCQSGFKGWLETGVSGTNW